MRFFPKLTPIVAATDEEAAERYRDFLSYSSTYGIFTLLGAWTGLDFARRRRGSACWRSAPERRRAFVESPRRADAGKRWSTDELATRLPLGYRRSAVGGPQAIADGWSEFLEATGAYGFNVAAVIQPGTIEAFAEHVAWSCSDADASSASTGPAAAREALERRRRPRPAPTIPAAPAPS